MTYTYAYHQYTSAITSNANTPNVIQMPLTIPFATEWYHPRIVWHQALHFIIGNVTGEHLPRCHYLITVCRNDTVVSAILNTEKQEKGFSCQICTLSDNVVQVGKIAVSTVTCFNMVSRESLALEIWAFRRMRIPLRNN